MAKDPQQKPGQENEGGGVQTDGATAHVAPNGATTHVPPDGATAHAVPDGATAHGEDG